MGRSSLTVFPLILLLVVSAICGCTQRPLTIDGMRRSEWLMQNDPDQFCRELVQNSGTSCRAIESKERLQYNQAVELVGKGNIILAYELLKPSIDSPFVKDQEFREEALNLVAAILLKAENRKGTRTYLLRAARSGSKRALENIQMLDANPNTVPNIDYARSLKTKIVDMDSVVSAPTDPTINLRVIK